MAEEFGAKTGVLEFAGDAGSGRSRRLASALQDAASSGRPCLLVDAAGAWHWRLEALPEGTVVLNPEQIAGEAARAGILTALSVLFWRTPGLVIGIDDCEFLGVGGTAWFGVKAAAIASGGLLICVQRAGSAGDRFAPRLRSRQGALALLQGFAR